MKKTAGAVLPPSLQKVTKRRSDRNKKQERRAKARKVVSISTDGSEYQTAVWVDALEGVDPSTVALDDDDAYDELDELLDSKPKKKKRKREKSLGTLPKRFLPRTLAAILLDDVSRSDAAKLFLDSEARVSPSQQMPPRKFCPVTGLLAKYTEPKSGMGYSTMRALDQIRERPPPWLILTGAAAYFEATKSIRDQEC